MRSSRRHFRAARGGRASDEARRRARARAPRRAPRAVAVGFRRRGVVVARRRGVFGRTRGRGINSISASNVLLLLLVFVVVNSLRARGARRRVQRRYHHRGLARQPRRRHRLRARALDGRIRPRLRRHPTQKLRLPLRRARVLPPRPLPLRRRDATERGDVRGRVPPGHAHDRGLGRGPRQLGAGGRHVDAPKRRLPRRGVAREEARGDRVRDARRRAPGAVERGQQRSADRVAGRVDVAEELLEHDDRGRRADDDGVALRCARRERAFVWISIFQLFFSSHRSRSRLRPALARFRPVSNSTTDRWHASFVSFHSFVRQARARSR